jgi:hypothetical protein
MSTDLDLAEEDFKPHWMINPVPEEGGINDGKNDSRTATDYADYTALRAKGWETVIRSFSGYMLYCSNI